MWRPTRARPELAGELLLATNTNGDVFLRFAKPPFSLATAQSTANRWQIEFSGHSHRRRGRGRPPDRFAWFELPLAFGGAALPPPWRFSGTATNPWCLENGRTGERVEGVFFR